jgi:hypothetical protein
VSSGNAPQVSQNLDALNLLLINEKEPKPVTMMALKLIAGAAVFDLASQKIMSLKDAIHPTTKMGKLVNKIKNFIKPREVARLQELETGVARIYMKLARLSSDYGVDLANVDLPTAERHTVGQQFSLADIATLIENKESYTLLELVTAGQNQHENALRESRVIEKKIRRALENMNAVFLGQLNTDGRNGIITFPPALKRKVETEADNAKSHLANASTLISQIKKELHGIDKILDALKMQDELGDFKSAVMDRLYGLGIEYKALLAKFEPIILKRTEQMTTLLGYSNTLAANRGQHSSEELVKNLKSILGTTNLTRSGNEF